MAKDTLVNVRCTQAEKDAWQWALRRRGLTITEVVRKRLERIRKEEVRAAEKEGE